VNPLTPEQQTAVEAALTRIEQFDQELQTHFRHRILTDRTLTRQLVSFQANKTKPIYRWYKYKEAFSASLVNVLLNATRVKEGPILDPFAGSGTALFAASEKGLDADGIELLPIGQEIIQAKSIVENELTTTHLDRLSAWIDTKPWQHTDESATITELRITKGAYPSDTKTAIEHYVAAYQSEPQPVRVLLRFALLCVLEEISYTRKDGQYLRWDERSGRQQGKKPFNKGQIIPFTAAITNKLTQIVTDITGGVVQQSLFGGLEMPTAAPSRQGSIRLFGGSCLKILPTLPSRMYTAIVTSPPYCNRYDYTRTYALELAVLGIDERRLVELRQSMLSCTVENRAKDLLAYNRGWANALATADNQQLLRQILNYLDGQNEQGLLNNSGIARMVRGYFYEMACVIAECARVLLPGAPLIMVNDNVRYAGAAISVDLILSDIAEHLGFHCENILVLPNGKGNSSQQMGTHGRQELRKCVYVWRRL